MDKTLKKQRFLFILLDTIILACLTVGCCCCTPVTQPVAQPVTPTIPPIAKVSTPASVVRIVPRVWAGTYITPTPLPELTDNNSHNLATGDYVQTNHDGIARLTIGACTNVYLYNDSSLTKGSSCTQSTTGSGGWNCVAGGFSTECESAINIITPSAKVQTTSTWFVVLYLPETKLTIVQVIHGSVTVTPFLEIPASQDVPAPEGKSQSLGDSSFWFTAPGPDENPPEIGGLVGRQPIPLDNWSKFTEGMNSFDPAGVPQLDIWMAQIHLRSVIDGSVFPGQLQTGITLNGQGPLMAQTGIQDAIVSAADWNQWMKQFFPEKNLQLTSIFPDRVLDVLTSTFDPYKARNIIENAKAANPDLSLFFVYSPEFEKACRAIQSAFEEIGLTLKVEPVNTEGFNEVLYKHIKDGDSVFWINSAP